MFLEQLVRLNMENEHQNGTLRKKKTVMGFEPTILLDTILCFNRLSAMRRDENVLQSHINNYLFQHFHFKFI